MGAWPARLQILSKGLQSFCEDGLQALCSTRKVWVGMRVLLQLTPCQLNTRQYTFVHLPAQGARPSWNRINLAPQAWSKKPHAALALCLNSRTARRLATPCS